MVAFADEVRDHKAEDEEEDEVGAGRGRRPRGPEDEAPERGVQDADYRQRGEDVEEETVPGRVGHGRDLEPVPDAFAQEFDAGRSEYQEAPEYRDVREAYRRPAQNGRLPEDEFDDAAQPAAYVVETVFPLAGRQHYDAVQYDDEEDDERRGVQGRYYRLERGVAVGGGHGFLLLFLSRYHYIK